MMRRYRTKPVEVMAERWQTGKSVEGVVPATRAENAYVVTRFADKVYLNEGDWVVKDRIGLVVVGDELFGATFDPVESD